MTDIPFWQRKKLEEMTVDEWESLCDGCGQCCLHKLIDADTDRLYFTNVACQQLNIHSCECKNYTQRFRYEPDCIQLTQKILHEIDWLPSTCAYRLLAEGKPLADWHPLIRGSKALMHEKRISVRNIAVHEKDMLDWESHIISSSEV